MVAASDTTRTRQARTPCRRGAAGRGVVLLEVVLSMGILFLGMAVIGLQVHTGLDIARNVEFTLRANMLVDTLLAELDAGAVRPDTNDDRIEGDFGIRAPGYAWRIGIEPTDTENLLMLTIQISYNAEDAKEQMDDPEKEIEFDETQVLRTVYRLYPTPAQVNLERDFGITQEDLQAFFGGGSDRASGGGEPGTERGGGEGPAGGLASLADQLGVDLSSFDFLFDESGFDPRQLAQLPEEDFLALTELLQELLSKGGGALTELAGGLKEGGGKQDSGRR